MSGSGRIGGYAVIVAVAAAVFIGLALWMRSQQEAVVAAAIADERLGAVSAARPVAEVASAVAAMKLVTVEIDSRVWVRRGDESWRGDVAATVEMPVRLHYGTDLSGLDAGSVVFSRLLGSAGGYWVKVPRPRRIATEVFPEREVVNVDAGGLRLKSRAGEYYLGIARRDAAAAAREMVLGPDDARKVEELTREQVEKLVRGIVGRDAAVRVRFAEENEAGETRADAPRADVGG